MASPLSTPSRAARRALGQALLDCVLLEDPSPLFRMPLDGPAAVGAVLDALRYHRLDAYVADLARNSPTPPALVEPLRRMRLTRLMLSTSLVADLQWMQRIFDQHRLTWVALKGPVTAERYYKRPVQRSFTDLDALVPPAQFETAVDALQSAGARLLECNWALVRELGCGELNFILPYGTYLDLHWSLMAAPHDRRAFGVDPEDLIERRVEVQIDGRHALSAPDAVDELVHLCLHACIEGTSSIGRLRDVALAAEATDDWDEVFSRSSEWRVSLPVSVALHRAWRLFHCAPPPGAIRHSPSPSWTTLMRHLEAIQPPLLAPPATRWTNFAKLTRSGLLTSLTYSMMELAGYAVHPLHSRRRDAWDQRSLQAPDGDLDARAAYFTDVSET